MHLQQSPAFGNATGISSSSPHFPKKMNLNNENIVLPRIKNNSTSTNTTQACAACKYQRRKCEPNCILSPYFPHNRQSQFLNAHKLFGVSNITKIIRDLSPADKDQAMKTIIFQSDVRANDPVGGCYRIIKELQFMIEYYQAELDLVMHQLSIFRAQHNAQTTTKDQQGDHNNNPQFLPFMTSDQAANNNYSDPNSDVINADPLSAYSPSSLQCSYQHQQQLQQEQLNLQLGGVMSSRGKDEDNNFILVNEENHRYESGVQENGISNAWVCHDKDEEEEEAERERMVNYCLNENEEDRCNVRDSFDDHKKDISSSFDRNSNKLKFEVEEDHEGGSSRDETTMLNDIKNLCTIEANANGLVQEEGYENEDGSGSWFRLTNSKRRKTTSYGAFG